VSSPESARDAIDLVAATINAPTLPPGLDAITGIVEHAIFGEDLVDGGAPTRGVVFAEDVAKIPDHQSRYAVGH
jgi:hypothetical protein